MAVDTLQRGVAAHERETRLRMVEVRGGPTDRGVASAAVGRGLGLPGVGARPLGGMAAQTRGVESAESGEIPGLYVAPLAGCGVVFAGQPERRLIVVEGVASKPIRAVVALVAGRPERLGVLAHEVRLVLLVAIQAAGGVQAGQVFAVAVFTLERRAGPRLGVAREGEADRVVREAGRIDVGDLGVDAPVLRVAGQAVGGPAQACVQAVGLAQLHLDLVVAGEAEVGGLAFVALDRMAGLAAFLQLGVVLDAAPRGPVVGVGGERARAGGQDLSDEVRPAPGQPANGQQDGQGAEEAVGSLQHVSPQSSGGSGTTSGKDHSAAPFPSAPAASGVNSRASIS